MTKNDDYIQLADELHPRIVLEKIDRGLALFLGSEIFDFLIFGVWKRLSFFFQSESLFTTFFLGGGGGRGGVKNCGAIYSFGCLIKKS